MQANQIYPLLKDTTAETLGESVVVNEDLSNLVDVGKAVFDNGSFDAFTKKLVDKVGKMVFVDRKYTGFGVSLMKDSWEYGAVLQKVSSEMPESTENESYDLVNGASYDNQVFYGTPVDVKFYNKYVTFEIDKSITEKQLKSAFNSVGEMNGFLSMIYNEVEKKFTVDLSNLAKRTLNNMIAETYHDGGVARVINLKAEYTALGKTFTGLDDVEFLKFSAKRIKETSDRMTDISTLFNIGGKERFTPKDYQKIVLHSAFNNACDTYLQSVTFHNEFTKLPGAEVINYWQGTGTDYALASTGKIDVHTANGDDVVIPCVIGCIFDRDAMGINCLERWTRTAPNGKGDFTNYFYKMKAQYYNDTNENMVIFVIE